MESSPTWATCEGCHGALTFRYVTSPYGAKTAVAKGAQPPHHFPPTDFDAVLRLKFCGTLANVIQKHLKRKYGLDGA